MTERDLSHNLLMAYMTIKSANECLKTIYEFKDKVSNDEFIETIGKVIPENNRFIKMIDETLLADIRFSSKDFEQLEENCYKVLDELEKEIRTL